MSGDFEKKIKQQMDGFRLTPGPQVWEQVKAALPEKRKRRLAIWWWLPLAACLGGGAWLMIDKQTDTGKKLITGTAKSPSAKYPMQEELSNQAPGDTSGNNVATHQQTATIFEKQNGIQPTNKISKTQISTTTNSRSSVQVAPDKKEEQINNYAGKNSVALQPAITKSTRVTAIAETKENKAETEPPVNDESSENVTIKLNAATDDVPLQNPVNSFSFFNKVPIALIIDSASNYLATAIEERDTIVSTIMDTLPKTDAAIKLPPTKNNSHKTEWSLMLAAGRSSLSGSNSESQKSYAAADNLSNSPGPSGQVRATGSLSNPTDGIAASVGVTLNQTISKHFIWGISISYHLLTAEQLIGSRNDSLIRLDASTSVAFYPTIRVANSSGQSIIPGSLQISNRLNKVHRLQIENSIGYIINPAAHSPIRFATGGFVAYNVSNNVLLHDYRSTSYIRSDALSNKWMWGGEVGLDVFINHKIQAGLSYQQDFTNVGKPKVRSVFRWNQLQLRVGIPLSKR